MPSATRTRTAAIMIFVLILVSILYLNQSDIDLGSSPIPIKSETTETVTGPIIVNKTTTTNSRKKIIPSDEFRRYGHCSTKDFEWVSDPDDDGTIVKTVGDKIVVSHLLTGKVKLEIPTANIQFNGSVLLYDQFRLVLSQSKLLLFTNPIRWGHTDGTLHDLYLFNIETNVVEELASQISTVVDGPSQLVYVANNDLYIYDQQISTRITNDGGPSLRNGIADWVYREEVYGKSTVIWLSKSSTVAWLKTNDSNVETFDFKYYKMAESQYPIIEKLHYPKAGTRNPNVQLWVYKNDISQEIKIPIDDRLIVQVEWIDEELLVRTMNRVQDQQELYLIAWKPEIDIKLLRNETVGDNGWFQHRQPLKVCGAGYAELQNHNDFVQIKYYQDKKTGVWITQGDSDVTQIYHCSNDKVYFARAEGNGAERHVYELNLHDFGTTSLITEAVKSIESLELPFTSSPQPRGYYEASFSPLAKFYRLSYDGPEFPWEIVKETKSASIISTLKTCDSEKKLLDYEYPQTEYNTIKNENGDEMNMKIIYPPNFNVHSTYPVMMQVYGGPESQTASKQYSIDFLNRVALNGVIGVQVDGRGTGFKGRKFLISVSKNLGHFELQDQIFAAKWLAKQPFVDAARIGIWGWSYGGYLTARAIEADAHVFKFGISVAPVTNWLYYDSIYTERFMKTPLENPDGYDQSSIKEMDGFENSKFLLIHGTADTNVHFQNSADLIWRLTGALNTKYTVQVYTDSDHDIQENKARIAVYNLIESFICTNFNLNCTINNS